MTVGREEPLPDLARQGDPGATGRPFVDWAFENGHGQRVGVSFVAPTDPGPTPP